MARKQDGAHHANRLTDSELREIIRSNRLRIKDLMLTHEQNYIIDCCDGGHKTSLEISKIIKCSIPSASARLKKLYDMGYLQREEVKQPSGGIEYLYFRGEC